MADFLRSTVLYVGLLACLSGLLTLIKPLRLLRIPTRRRALAVALAGVAAILSVTIPLPATIKVGAPDALLDNFAPLYQFREIHETTIAAPPDRVFAAIKSVTADDIALFQTFTRIRRFGRSGPESIVNAPGAQPILATALKSGFLLLADETPREIVFGVYTARPAGVGAAGLSTPEAYRTIAVPGLAKATMNFRLQPAGAATRLTTETRVFATDEPSLRVFTSYWRVIYPGSAILRITWLRAIKQRAEGYNPR